MDRFESNYISLMEEFRYLIHVVDQGLVEEGQLETLTITLFMTFYLSGLVLESSFDPNILTNRDFLAYARGDKAMENTASLAFYAGYLILKVHKRYLEIKEMSAMRKDEGGNTCPSTLGEYRDMCFAITGESRATELLDSYIATSGRDEKVIQDDSQMRYLLMPLLLDPPVGDGGSSSPTLVKKVNLSSRREALYVEVCGVAASLVGRGWEVLLDINFDPSEGEDDWKIVMVITHPKGESTFIIQATPKTTYTHLSDSRGEAVDLGDFSEFRQYLEGFYN